MPYCRQILVLGLDSSAGCQGASGGWRFDPIAPPKCRVSGQEEGLFRPLAECRPIVTGTDVQIATSAEKIMSALRAPGQTSFAFVFDLQRTVEEMKKEIEATQRKPLARDSVAQPAWVHTKRRAF